VPVGKPLFKEPLVHQIANTQMETAAYYVNLLLTISKEVVFLNAQMVLSAIIKHVNHVILNV
jgi:hypothetical protein